MPQQTKQKQLSKIVDEIVDQFEPKKILLFGSYAWGEPDKNSDIDLIVVKKTDNVKSEAQNIDGSIYPRPFLLDIIVYTPSQFEQKQKDGSLFIKNVISQGEILYEQE